MFLKLINFIKRKYREKLILDKRREFNNYIKSIIQNKFTKNNDKNILIDAMWDNPYHFLRLLIIKFAMNKIYGGNLIGIINSDTKKGTIETFESLQLKKILNTNEDKIGEKYLLRAKKVFKNKKKLPFNYPYVFLEDDICKKTKNPFIDIKKSETINTAAKCIYFLDFYKNLIKTNKIECAVLSHQVTIRYSTLIWLLLKKNIPVYVTHYINGHITCRKYVKTSDLLSAKDDYLDYKSYKSLPKKKINYSINLAKKYHESVKKNRLGVFQFLNVYKKKNIPIKKILSQKKI